MKAITTKTEIQSAAIARGTDKVTHQVFYVVQSDSDPNTWYQVKWNNEALAWQCECPSRKPCKHERAVQEVLKLRRQRIALAMGGQVPAIIAELQAREDVKLAANERPFDDPFIQHSGNVVVRDLPPSLKGNLNFSNRREIKTENGVPMR